MRFRAGRVVGAAVGLGLLAGAVWVLHRELRHYSFREVVQELLATSPSRIGLAIGATVISYAALIGHDLLALRALGIELPARRAVSGGFAAFAFANSLPFAVVSGAAVRSRFYEPYGIPAGKIAELAGFNVVTYAVGLLGSAGLAFTLQPEAVPRLLHLPVSSTLPLGVLALLLVAAFLFWSGAGKPVIRIWKWTLVPTSLRFALLRVGVSMADWLFSGAGLFALLPDSTLAGYPRYFGVFLLGQIAGLISQLPGGIGVFEAVVARMLRESSRVTGTIGALILYRAIYFLLPLLAAVPLLLAREIGHWKRRKA